MTSYVVFNHETSAIMRNKHGKGHWASEAAAKSFLTRMTKMGYRKTDFGIIELSLYTQYVEKTVLKTNLMTGKSYRESVNTPRSCSPSSETYWSM